MLQENEKKPKRWTMEDAVIKIGAFDVLISACDVGKVMTHKWHITSKGKGSGVYFSTYISPKKSVMLHRFILDVPSKMTVDHITGDTLDNRRENLRICSTAENNRNKPKYSNKTAHHKGVYFYKTKRKPWRARININKKSISLGYFSSSEEAHAAYCEAAKKYHGEFARFN